MLNLNEFFVDIVFPKNICDSHKGLSLFCIHDYDLQHVVSLSSLRIMLQRFAGSMAIDISSRYAAAASSS